MGFFSKLWKGVKKTFKKIGKGIKKVFKKVGKWAGKLGVVGQIALSFIPFGQLFAPLLQGFSSSFLGILGKGLASANPLIKGASWMVNAVNAAYKTGSAIYKGYKTVTGAVSKFIGETVGFIGSKIPGVNKVIGENAAGSFFGTGSDSVLGRVGEQVSSDWNGFKKAVGGIVELNPTKTGLEYMERANILKGEYRYQDDRLSKIPTPEEIPVVDKSTTENIPVVESIPVVDKSINIPVRESIPVVDKSKDLQFTPNANGNDATYGLDLVLKEDAPVDTQSLLGRVGENFEESLYKLPGNMATSLATTAVQQEVMGEQPTIPQSEPRRALDLNYSPLSYNIGQVIANLDPLSVSPTSFYQSNDYNALMANLMNSTGVSGGAFGNPFMNLSQQQAA